MRKILGVALAVLLSAGLAGAQDFEAGQAAYVSGDYAAAVNEWRPLAEAGDALAQYSLAEMYLRGTGVPQDYGEAARLYRLAANQGNAIAQTRLGFLYEQGEFVSHDDVEAARWYRLAANQGHAGAHTSLGLMYKGGEGVLQDNVRAHMHANLGCALGNVNGCQLRELVSESMTLADISKAQRRATVCMLSDYKNCD